VPYRLNSELPRSVRAHLPPAAQTIYRKVFNNAWDEYSDPGKRRERLSREATAHRVAWAAVKKAYRKRGDGWIRRPVRTA
jgi:cation transport regulator